MCTYNHEKYIAQAIEGVVMQKTNFKFRLHIGEDASTDSTKNIVLNYSKKYPEIIFPVFHEKNIGPAENTKILFSKCTSKYIALCDGDDYWTDPLKLQKQVDLLESNDNIGLVYTKSQRYIQNLNKYIEMPVTYPKHAAEVIPLLIRSKYIDTPTTVFRKTILEKVLDIIKIEMTNAIVGDTRIYLETAHNSEIYFLNEITAVYRVADGSASNPQDINNYILLSMDTYLCRKTFVLRNKLNTNWLSDTICNTNRGLIKKAYESEKYSDTINLLKNLLILDTIKYCSWTVFIDKMKIDIWAKLILSIFGIGFFRQKINIK